MRDRLLEDAERDGEKILGVVRGIGTASDGKGKSAYAPNRRGQILAMQRALADANLQAKDIDYVIAHATGTPVGDATEYGSLIEVYGGQNGRGPGEVFLGSNKGNFGHLGWTAGAASIIQALLVFREKEIPPQAGFQQAQGGIDLSRGPFRIAKEVTALPTGMTEPVRIAVSGFGFGGTNAHILLEEYSGMRTSAIGGYRLMTPPKCQTFCVVAWSAMLPGALGREALEGKVAGGAAGRFSQTPHFDGIRFRMPPPTQRLADPAQLLLLKATDDLLTQLPGEVVEQLRSHTGVFIASTGGGQMWVSHAMRIQRDLMRRNLESDTLLQSVLETVIEESMTRFPRSGEDSFPGLMPNLLAGRIANIFDLHGINEVVDADVRSFLSALEIACRALSQEDLNCALVGGCTPIAMDAIAPGLTAGDEGVGLIAIVRSEIANQFDLPVVARLRLTDTSPDPLDAAWNGNGATDRIGDLPNLAGLPEMLDALARRTETSFSRGMDGYQLGQTAQKSDRIRRPDPCKIFHSRLSPALIPSSIPNNLLRFQMIDFDPASNNKITSEHAVFILEVDAQQLCTTSQVGDWLNQLSHFTAERIRSGESPGFIFKIHHAWNTIGSAPLTSCLQSWLLSFSKEQPDSRLLLLASSTDYFPEPAHLLWWEQSHQHPVSVFWDPEKGWLSQQFVETLLSPSATSVPLGIEGIILVLGGSSGLGLVTARQLARRHGNTVVLVGRSAITPDEWYPAPLPGEGVFFQQMLAKQKDKIDIKKLRSLYRNLCAKREKYVNLSSLPCAGVRFSYEQCDVTDSESVRDLVARVQSTHGRIDAVIYSVIDPDLNLELLKDYDPEVFSRLWKSKTLGLQNTLEALRAHPPALIINASSISTLGIKGLVNYSAANAFQSSMLSAWAEEYGSRYINIGWPGWAESGISHRIDPAQKNAVADTTFLSDMQGAEFADRLVSSPDLKGTIWLLGEGDRKQFLSQVESAVKPSWVRGPEDLPFVDEFMVNEKTTWVKCRFTSESEGWLDGHLIAQDPVVPGTGLLELVAESVAVAAPNKRITAISDINFRRFVKLSKARPITLYVIVSQSGYSSDLYHVDIHSDLFDGQGKLLQYARHHLSALVETNRHDDIHEPPSANWSPLDHAKWFHICEPYLAGAAGITLGGVFDTMQDIKTSAIQAQGTYRGHLGDAEGKLSKGILPLVLLDGALRLAALCPNENGEISVFAPVYLKRLRLHQSGGDSYWSNASQSPIARYYFPRDGRAGTLEITDGRGQMILTVEGLAGHVLGKQPWISPDNLSLPPLVSSVLRRSAHTIEVSVPIDPLQIPHLFTSAQLNNQPVLPGSWQMAIAAEVAGMLRPGWAISAITDQTFSSALKLHAGRVAPLRVKAKIVVDSDEQCHVNCRLVSDVVHPNGTLLESDRHHGSLNVILQASLTLAPITPLPFNSDQSEAQPWIPEILYWPHSHLRLGQGFSAICNTLYDGRITQCCYRNPASLPDVLGQLRLPPLLLDAMLQPVLPQKGRIIGTGIPKRIGAVHFAANFNEQEIREQWGELLIRSEGDTDSAHPIHITVSTPDGSVGLIRVEDFETYSLGAIDVPSGLPLSDSRQDSLNRLINEHPDYDIPVRYRRFWAPAVIRSGKRRRSLAEGRMARVAIGESCIQLLATSNIPHQTTEPDALDALKHKFESGLDRLEIHLDGASVSGYNNKNSWMELADTMSKLHHLSQLFLNRPGLLVQLVVHQSPSSSSLAHAVIGWSRSLAKDFASNERDLCRCWLVDGLKPALILAKLVRDAQLRIPGSDAIQWHSPQGVRVAHLREDPPIAAKHSQLTPNSTVLITGGTGGIGLAVADALHRRYGCRLLLIGRTEPAASDDVLPSKAKYLADWKKNSGQQSILEAVEAYGRLVRRFKIRDSLATLRARGAKVESFAVDLADSVAVGTLVQEILRRYGKVESLFHFAGIEASSDTVSKSQSMFLRVLSAKISSSLALYHAFDNENAIPDLWVHGSSIMATFGIPGATDYGAANAWLEGFHLHLREHHPACSSLLIEWTAWGGAGMLSNRPELWERTGLWTGQRIGPEMGARLMIRELESIESGSDPILIVHQHPVEVDYEPERRAVGVVNKPLLLDQIQTLGDCGWEGLCHLTPERYRQLSGHTTDGIPSLPGSFELALAVDLLHQVLPVWKLVELRNVDYNRFVKVPKNTVLPVRVRVRIQQTTSSELRLALELVSDFVHSTGQIIDHDRIHWSAEAVLRLHRPAPPDQSVTQLDDPTPPLRDVLPAHYHHHASIAYTDDVRSLHSRQIDALGHAWGKALLSGWELRHPIMPILIGADAMALSPCLGSADEPIVHVNNRTEVIYFFDTLDSTDRSGQLGTHAWPLDDCQDGNYRCPRLEVRNASNELVVLALNAWFLAYDSRAALSNSAAFVLHHSAT